MITPVVMPQMGLEVTEGTVAEILVSVGDAVEEGAALFEMETDKAIAEVTAPRAGIVRKLEVSAGETVAIGAVLLLLADTADEAIGAPTDAPPGPAAYPPGSPPEATPAAPPVPARDGSRVRAAPVARRAAKELGVDLATVTGTGPRGRVTLGDIKLAARSTGSRRSEPLTGFHRAALRNLTASQLIPQFVLFREIDVSWLLREKARLAASQRVGLSVNDLLLQAFAEILQRHPRLGASLEDRDGEPVLSWPATTDLGLAVAGSRGLLVPVVRDVQRRTLAEISSERRRLVELARAGRLEANEMSGATATISSLASFGVDAFQAMLNPGQSSILSVGQVVDRVVPRDRGLAVTPRTTLGLTLDHRVVDGAVGAAALADLGELLESAMEWRT